ncbi:hypothetical protein [Vibrio paucivorans]|uniref:Uncharacterized protein n=1 Tax=Vibrio paucivorans TaxID=2829489 RepID=A0A9X3CE87_9VIBR|nr:hypothetical protein [Vibrio paucivorans]MCW8334217.1 hypothetical protein [Vibrio paucivorans]
MSTETKNDTAEQEATTGELILGSIILLAGPILMAAAFSSGHWLYDTVPGWVNKTVLVIGGIISLITINWKWTAATFGALALAFNYMPGGEDPLDTWVPRIHAPQAGDLYVINTFKIRDVEKTDDNEFVFYRVTSFTNEEINFEQSTKRYSFDTVNKMLKDRSAYDLKYHEGTNTFTKVELEEKLREFTIGGVFRLPSEKD